jgi:Diacylglycerol kinase accessory domain.
MQESDMVRMNNYSLIIIGFDKSRTQSRCRNKVVYCWEGFKKLFKSTPRVNDVVDRVENVKSHDPTENVNSECPYLILLDSLTKHERRILCKW